MQKAKFWYSIKRRLHITMNIHFCIHETTTAQRAERAPFVPAAGVALVVPPAF